MSTPLGARATRATISVLRSVSKTADLPLPKSLVTELDKIDQREATALGYMVDNHQTAERREMTDALARDFITAAENGADPGTDPGVQAHITRLALHRHGVREAVEKHYAGQRALTLDKHTPALMNTWAKAVEEASAAITEATRRFPTVDLTDETAGARLRREQVSLWRAARDGIDTLGDILKMWQTLGQEAGVYSPRRKYAPLILAPLTATQLDSLAPTYTAWRAVLLAPAALATPEEHTARVARVDEDRQRAAAEAERAFKRRAGAAGAGRAPWTPVTA